MATTEIVLGKKTRINVVFRELDDGQYVPVDPDTVIVEIFEVSTGTPVTGATPPNATQEGVGEYYYDWTPDTEGGFKVQFTGYFSDDRESVVTEDFSVVTALTPITVLGTTYEMVFASDFDPLLVDPEEFVFQFPEAELVEIAELVYRYSLEVQEMAGSEELNLTAYEYVRAAVLCALSRTYDSSLLGADGGSMSLGDLTISKMNTPPNRYVNRANANTPCELAAVLRKELVNMYGANMKAVVTGTKFKNPMPKRGIRHAGSPTRQRDMF